MTNAGKKYQLFKMFEARAKRSLERLTQLCILSDDKIPPENLGKIVFIKNNIQGVHQYIADALAAMEEIMRDPEVTDFKIADISKLSECLDTAELVLPVLEKYCIETISSGVFEADASKNSYN